ncbi:hypothetical protein NDU88_008276 [Pleurodeles waltl]|uniref:Uncharacterized protein n=1 Tax=Pleurodeles waltl TaxID=8319 RepID=A0AAV7PPA5_PLEWA|nr:hypothetical protein NDU88_008276 [Pleurodeles waltl]
MTSHSGTRTLQSSTGFQMTTVLGCVMQGLCLDERTALVTLEPGYELEKAGTCRLRYIAGTIWRSRPPIKKARVLYIERRASTVVPGALRARYWGLECRWHYNGLGGGESDRPTSSLGSTTTFSVLRRVELL